MQGAVLTPFKNLIGSDVSFRSRAGTSKTHRSNLASLIPSIIILILSLVALVAGSINLSRVVTAPGVMSICLVIYNVVPHCLLILYWNFGPGSLLSKCCRVGMLTTGVCSCTCVGPG